MMAIATETGRALRYFPEGSGVVGYHRAFGFVSEKAAAGRRIVRGRRAGSVAGAHDEWLCRFSVGASGPKALSGCEFEAIGPGRWRFSSAAGTYVLQPAGECERQVAVVAKPGAMSRAGSGAALFATVLFASVAVYSLEFGRRDLTPLSQLEQKTVAIPQVKVKPPEPPKEPEKKKEVAKAVVQKTKDTKATAVKQQLGFLALLGKKDLTKAVGGMPTQAERRSPGAGLGGDQGSGGELLTGLGQGVKHTTVGNTGVAGLGGIGKAGAGGGEGGFGHAYVGSGGPGGGRALAGVSLGDNVELEGGLDKAVIQATIAKYLSQVRACYERGLRKVPGLTGQVLMDFEINAGGNLNYAHVKQSSLDQHDVEGCIAKVMLTWKFPKPVGGTLVKVNYPFMLKPASYL